jgi:hypothetical protein
VQFQGKFSGKILAKLQNEIAISATFYSMAAHIYSQSNSDAEKKQCLSAYSAVFFCQKKSHAWMAE